MKLYSCILAILITFFGCKDELKSDYAYLGGQIINPKNNFVVFLKDEKVLDTILLDGYNRFIYKIDSLQEGMYTFKHGDEFQMVLLEPQDSIMLRLNTLDFDESLVYTGVGAKKNNYFTNEFLQNEIEEKKIFKFCQLDPKTYETRIESIRTKKVNELNAFKAKYPTSKNFDKIAQANIDYNYYFNKEVYPFVHYGKNKIAILATMPEGFYSYRSKVNYNDDMLKDYFTYKSFLRTNVNNLGLERHSKHSDEVYLEKNSMCYTLDRLAVIDSLIANTAIKNNLLYHYTINALTRFSDDNASESVLQSYLSKSTDKDLNNMVERYAAAVNRLKVGNRLPEVAVMDYNGKIANIVDASKNVTVISFWSHTNFNHFKDSHKKIKELRIKYPEVQFVSVNVDDYDLETTKKTLERNFIPFTNEYQVKNSEAAKETLAIFPLTKTIILDSDQIIVDSNANIFDKYFEESLLGAINR